MMDARTGMKRLAMAVALAAALALILTSRSEVEKPKARAADPNYFAFVHSMEGTRPDGDIKLAAGDELVVDAELARLFDYYLAGQGERSLADIRAETERELDRRLGPKPALHAKRLLAQYWHYKEAVADLEKTAGIAGGTADALRKRMAARQALRAQFFSAAEIAGLFGFDDAYDADAVARVDIGQDKTLSEAQKKQKLAALDAALSPALREERVAPRRVLMLEQSVQQMRAQGASDDEVYRARAAAISPEAAARLAEVDRDEVAWKARIDVYLSERAAIVKSGAPDQQTALAQLRETRFTSDEQRRLGAYE
jgi:lipase chaperone LimK